MQASERNLDRSISLCRPKVENTDRFVAAENRSTDPDNPYALTNSAGADRYSQSFNQ